MLIVLITSHSIAPPQRTGAGAVKRAMAVCQQAACQQKSLSAVDETKAWAESRKLVCADRLRSLPGTLRSSTISGDRTARSNDASFHRLGTMDLRCGRRVSKGDRSSGDEVRAIDGRRLAVAGWVGRSYEQSFEVAR